MGDIAQLVRNEEIGFFNKDKRLDTNLDDFGKNYKKLADYIAKQSERYLTIKGNGLEEFLYKKYNLDELAGLLILILDKSISKKIEDEIKVHVEADIEKINKNYKKEKSDKISEDIRKYFPKMPEFERQWNAALIHEFAGWVGFPGYEWPESKRDYEDEIAKHATSFMIGTKDQLKRYKNPNGYYYKSYFNKEIMETLSGFE